MTTRLDLILKENKEREQKILLEERLERERRAGVELKYSNLLKNVAKILDSKGDEKSHHTIIKLNIKAEGCYEITSSCHN